MARGAPDAVDALDARCKGSSELSTLARPGSTIAQHLPVCVGKIQQCAHHAIEPYRPGSRVFETDAASYRRDVSENTVNKSNYESAGPIDEVDLEGRGFGFFFDVGGGKARQCRFAREDTMSRVNRFDDPRAVSVYNLEGGDAKVASSARRVL